MGKDQFTYTVSDGTDTSAPATVTITVKPAGGTGGGPLTSAVAGASAPFTYGKLGTVVASVAPAAATGKVEVLQGNDLIASGVLASGRATLVLPAKSLLPGTHQLTLRYVGDGGHKASSSTVEVTVDKVVPRMTVKAPSTVKKGKAPKVTVVLRAPDDVPVTGTVSIAIKGGKTLTRDARRREGRRQAAPGEEEDEADRDLPGERAGRVGRRQGDHQDPPLGGAALQDGPGGAIPRARHHHEEREGSIPCPTSPSSS